MEDFFKLLFPIIIAVIWIGGAIVKKLGQMKQEGMPGRPAADGDDRDEQSAFKASQDEVRAFLEQMGAAPVTPEPPPRPVPAPEPVAQPKPAPARAASSAAEALKAAAAKRVRKTKRGPAPAAAAPKPEQIDRLAAYRTKEPAAAAAGSEAGSIGNLSRLPFMQRAIALREILGPPPGLGRDQLERGV